MPVSDQPVTNADIVKEMRDWSGVHESDRGLRDAIKAAGGIDPLTTAWCAAYVNMTLDDLGLQGTGSNLAKSFRTLGTALTTPVPGAIAVFNRGNPNSIFGHVGVVTRVNPGTGTMDIIGGNQGNRVTTETRPIADAIAFRDVSLPGYAYGNSRFDTPSERMAAGRNAAAIRSDMLRDDAAVTAPYWDGTSAAPPVQSVQSAPLADLGVTTNPTSPGMSADPYNQGQYTPGNAIMGPVDFGGGLEGANAGYSEPVASSFGGSLADRVAPMETYSTGGSFGVDFAPSAPAADFGMGMEAANAGYSTPEVASSFGGPLADRASVPDTYSTGGSFGLDAAPSSFGSPLADRAAPAAFDFSPSSFGSPLADRVAPVDTYTTGGSFGVEAAPSSFGGRLADRAAPMDTFTTGGSFGVEDKPRTAAAQPNTALAREVPLDIPAPYPLDIPAYAPLDDLPAPINVGVKPAAAPSRAAPRSIAAPAPVRDFRPVEASQPARTERVGLERYDSPGGFLGGFLGGDRAAIGDLSRATGTDYTGLAQRAMGDDQYAQPAMLGLGNAYAEATGQQGYKGLFDGLFGGGPTTTQSSGGWGLGNLFSGENVGRGVGGVAGTVLGGPLGGIAGGYLGGVVGNAISPGYDPLSRDPARNGGTGGLYDPRENQGFFGGLFDGWGGNSRSDGLGTTPGAGGLY